MRRILFILFTIPAMSLGAVNNWAVPIKLEDLKNIREKQEVEEKNIPPDTSIDSLGICYGDAGAKMLNINNCIISNVADCSKLPDAERFSSVGLSRYASPAEGNSKLDKNYKKLDLDDNAANKDLQLSGAHILSMATDMVTRLPTESCSSLEKIVSKVQINSAGNLQDAQLAVWNKIRSDYDNYRKALAEKCDDCASKYYQSAYETVKNNLKIEEDEKVDPNIRNDSLRVLQAFQKETYAEALNTLLYPENCSKTAKKFVGYGTTKTDYFPREKDPKGVTPKNMLDEIKKVLQAKRPLLLEDICIEDCNDKKVEPKTHALVIAGYRKICKKNDPNNCRTALKVLNSWGAAWQKANSDGWIEADALLGSVVMKQASLSWITPKN